MSTAPTLAAYAAALALVFACAVGVGRAVGPIGPAAPVPVHQQTGPTTAPTHDHP